MANLPDLPDKVAEKIPTIDQWKKHGASSVQYVFMLLFFIYFFWNEVVRRDDCESLIAQRDVIIQQISERLDKYEKAFDVYRGINQNLEQHITSDSSGNLEKNEK